ncbi:hypothetical protein P3X46_034724 [Hevea brasiliensis]|uniref:PIG-P domain-containing protein n=1 Tax=Hevea brasiliensis TaxID=3981 RepID=A0ABQ9KAA3_HEVBR|nr:phosphatidylinositol N-acetylglucosaminyltransferase subunit P-like [Hevea brasiliensis]KAJ9128586.1 hypothetical protein P3X46_034724 [Hevea brasiliensis]
MEDHYYVSSPRRILIFSERRRATLYFQDPDDKASGVGASGDHGLKTSKIYGFVGSITTIVATVIFLVWAYIPELCLHSIGVFYYPNGYWALTIPTYATVTVVLAFALYFGLKFLSTPPPTSLSSIFDEFSREPADSDPLTKQVDQPIEPISDIGSNKINVLMLNNIK